MHCQSGAWKFEHASAHLPRRSMMACTTPGSARVDVSPSSSSFLTAILRRMRLMILPDRVFGSPEHSTTA